MKDWKAIAKGAGLDVNGQEWDRIVEVLSALDAEFQPLLAELSPECEPATVFQAGESGE